MKALVFWFVVGAVSAADIVVFTKTGQRITLDCSSSNFRSLSWHHGGDLIITVNGKSGMSTKGTAAIQERSRVKLGSNLEISAVKKEDAGQFTCTVDGKPREFTLVVVSAWASPSKKLRLGSKATLQCEVAGRPSDTTVQWRRPDQRPQDSETVHLNHVTHSDAGTWVCACSYAGKTFTESLDIEIEEPACTSPPTQSSKVSQKNPCTNSSCSSSGDTDRAPIGGLRDWWVWVAVGVGSFVVVLLMVCVIALCRRNLRNRRKLERMKRPRKYCQCNCTTAVHKQGRQKGKPSALPLKPQLMQ